MNSSFCIRHLLGRGFRRRLRNAGAEVNRTRLSNRLLLGYRARKRSRGAGCRGAGCPHVQAVARFERLSNSLLLGRRRAEDRKLIGYLEAPGAEAEDRRRSAAAAAGGAALARRLDHAPAQQDALEVRRRDVVPEGGGVELAELRDRERPRREREADVRVRELCPQALAASKRDLAMIERQLGQSRDGMPGRVLRELGIQPRWDEAEVRRRDLPFARVSSGIAERLQLLEVGDFAHVDLCGEVLADRLLERFAGLEVAARK